LKRKRRQNDGATGESPAAHRTAACGAYITGNISMSEGRKEIDVAINEEKLNQSQCHTSTSESQRTGEHGSEEEDCGTDHTNTGERAH
jgi:hypothetical protein